MKRIILFLITILSVSNLANAKVQKGFVRTVIRPNQKVNYISGVQISVKGRGGSFPSNNKGQFELELGKINQGEQFFLSSVYKKGYDLYDYGKNYSYNSNNPIEIVLLDLKQVAKDREDYADNMFKASTDNYNKKIKKLEDDVAAGKKTIEEYLEQLSSLEKAFDNYKGKINEYAKRYAEMDYAAVDSKQIEIDEAIVKGDFERVDSLLLSFGSTEDIISEGVQAQKLNEQKKIFHKAGLKATLEDSLKIEKDNKKRSEILYSKHLSYLDKLDIDSAMICLNGRVELQPNNIYSWMDLGEFIDCYLGSAHSSECYKQALSIAKQQKGENSLDAAKCYFNLANSLSSQHRYPEAEELLEKSLNIREEKYGGNNIDVADCYNTLGVIYRKGKNLDKALDCHKMVLRIFQDLYGEEHPILANPYNNLGMVYEDLNEKDMAMTCYLQGYKLSSTLDYPYSTHAKLCNNLGNLFAEKEDYNTALKLFQNALDVYLSLYGEKSHDAILCYDNIGYVYMKMNKYDEALAYTEESFKALYYFWNLENPKILKSLNRMLEIQRNRLGKNDVEVAKICFTIGETYSNLKDYDEALPSFQEALRIYCLSGDNIYIANCYEKLGEIYYILDKPSLSIDNFQKALNLKQNLKRNDESDLIKYYRILGTLYKKEKDYISALNNLEEGLKIQIATSGEEDPNVIKLYKDMVDLNYKLGDRNSTIENCNKLIATQIKVLGKTNPEVAHSYFTFGKIYSKYERYNDALVQFKKAYEIRSLLPEVKNIDVAETLYHIGEMYSLLEDYPNATENLEKSLNLYQSAGIDSLINIPFFHKIIGDNYMGFNELDKANQHYQEALRMQIDKSGENTDEVAEICGKLGVLNGIQEKYQESIKFFEKQLNIKKNLCGENHQDIASVYHDIGITYRYQGNYKEALCNFEKALQIRQNIFGENHPDVIELTKAISETTDNLSNKNN